MRLEQATLVCGLNIVVMLGCGVENWEWCDRDTRWKLKLHQLFFK
jgi:hypothetical protein